MASESEEDFPEFSAAHYLVLIVSPVLMLSGLTGNVISLCIFYPKAVKSRTQSSYTFLSVLALFDSLALLASSIRGFLAEAFGFNIVLACGCGYYLFFNYLVTDMAVYIIISMTIDRVISVFLPFKAKTYCTRDKALVSITVIFIILIGVNCVIIFTTRPVQQLTTVGNVTSTVIGCGPPLEHSDWMNYTWPWIDLTVLSFLPSGLLITFNAAILLRMRSQIKRVHAIGQPSHERLASQRRTNVLLLSICVVFFLSTTPLTVLHIVEPYWSRDDPHQKAIHTLLTTISLQLLTINNCMNFVLYCLSGREFRTDLRRMFCGQKEGNSSDEPTVLA